MRLSACYIGRTSASEQSPRAPNDVKMPNDRDPNVTDDRAKSIAAAAQRALDEAAQRRRKRNGENSLPAEVGGRDGPEPTRYGDWEKGGLASDF
jgi:hypothetical protein